MELIEAYNEEEIPQSNWGFLVKVILIDHGYLIVSRCKIRSLRY